MKRLLVVVAALAAALLIQLTIVNGLALPGDGAPDLVLLCVVAIGLTGGAQPGLIAGFCAGLALDLAPPANELIGQYALVFCLVGYACGRLRFTLTQSAVLAMVSAAGAAVAGELLAACLVLVLDTPQVTLATVASVLPASVLYDLVLSPVFIFAGVRIAVALGVSFSSLDDSPALEIGGSAQPTGLADLVRARRLRRTTGTDGAGVASSAWLTGDSAADVAAMGTVGWLNGPATSRRARREQARLTAALTGAAPRKGSFWVGGRPPGLRPTEGSALAAAQQSGLSKLRPESGVAGTAAQDGRPALRSGADGADLRGAAFQGSGSGGLSGSGWVSGGSNGPKIAFGTGGLPGAGRAAGKGVPKIAFKTSGPVRSAAGDGTGGGSVGRGRIGSGASTPKIAFGTGGLPGSGRAGGRGAPKIAFGSGLPRGARTSPGRPALPRFRSRSAARSASGAWLAGSRMRSAGLGATGPRGQARLPGSNYRAGGTYRPKSPRVRSWRRRRVPRWLTWHWIGRSRRGGTR